MKIVIVGGGTAGWICAYFINKSFPNIHEITVIESSSIGIIGAGEGSTGAMTDLLRGSFFNYNYKVDLHDFLEKTDGTQKYGIKHINWSKNKNNYFAPLDTSPTSFELDDYIFKYVFSSNIKNSLASKNGIEYENNIFSTAYALHFDGHKVGNFFRNICEKEHKNKIIDSVVSNVLLNEKGYVDYLLLENNKKIFGDIFIDCTGFQRKISSAVETKWISHSKVLPLNTAMPFIIKKKENEKIDPVTKAHAMSSGWMWEIPLKTRTGMGYVFDKNFISIDQAKLEIEKYLGKEIEPIKIINFDSGYVDKFWNKNVINFGLSSSFVEPLEATSIHNTIHQISIFVKEFLVINNKELFFAKHNEEKYNKRITKLNQLTIDFISIHYQGGKDDTPFWKTIKEEKIISDGAKEYVDYCKNRIPGYINLEGMTGSYSIPLVNWVGAGIGILNPKFAEDSLKNSLLYEKAKLEYNNFYNSIVEKNKKSYIIYS